MPDCTSCGRRVDGDFAFCPYCGAALERAPSAAGRSGAWVTAHCDGTVKRIDPSSNAVVQTIHTGYHPQWLAAAGGSVWVGITGKEYRWAMSCGSTVD